jgi:hypothetical protein
VDEVIISSVVDREEKPQEAEAAGGRLPETLDELGLSLSEAHLSMAIDILRIEDRGRSTVQ